MPRTGRLSYPGGIFHVISRCLEQRPLLEGEEERGRYLTLLASALTRTDARLLAWCLMSTHVHLVVQAGHEPLARLTKPVHSGYANWKNRKASRQGPVFADRPKLILVETEPYLLELVRYVHLNPVRAGVVSAAADSDWTSHRAYIGLAPRPPWLHRDLVMAQFPGKARAAVEAFDDFVAQGVDEGRRDDLSGATATEAMREIRRGAGPGAQVSDAIVGSPEFIARVLEAVGKTPADRVVVDPSTDGPDRTPGLRELTAATCEALDLDEATFRGRPKLKASRKARRVITWLWVRQYHKPQAEVARYLNAGTDQVSRWYGRAVDTEQELEPTLRQVVQMLPDQEPELARSAPATVSIAVDLVQD